MAEKHFYEQKTLTQSYLLPYFEQRIADFHRRTVLEVGCAESGFLDALHERGIQCVGVELEKSRIEIAAAKNPHLRIYQGDITDRELIGRIGERFDLIVMRDIIEHIADRSATLANIVDLLVPQGYLYITFPPKYSGFAGHQQNGVSILRRVPYVHLLPFTMLRWIGKLAHEQTGLIEMASHNFRTGLTIRSFEKLCAQYRFKAIERDLFLLRPVYRIRFGIGPRKIPNIPIAREFLAFGCEALLQHQD